MCVQPGKCVSVHFRSCDGCEHVSEWKNGLQQQFCRFGIMWHWVCRAGGPLWQILEAGDWSSPEFLNYLDSHQLDAELVVQAHCGESDSDDGIA